MKGLERISIAKIKIPKNYPRTNLKLKSLQNGKKKFVYPIVIDRNNNLVDGLRRLSYLKKKYTNKKVDVIRLDIAPEERFEWQLILNLKREDMNPIEKALAFKELIKLKKLSGRQLAKLLGISKSTVEYHLKMLELPVSVRKKIYDGSIKPYAIENLMYKNRAKYKYEFEKLTKEKQFESLFNKLVAFKSCLVKTSLDFEMLKKLENRVIEIADLINNKKGVIN